MPEETTKEFAIVLPDWPQPAVVAEPQLWANDTSLLIRYRTSDTKLVVVHFPLCFYVVFGQPNAEALGGHPLYSRGLQFYSVHVVKHSSLIDMLERRNSVHHQHNRASYLKDMKHYVFTFQDSTLECVVNEGEWWKPTVKVFDSEDDAEKEWKRARSP